MFSSITANNQTAAAAANAFGLIKTNPKDVECLITEKRNIINIFKLVVKDLIEISLKNNKHVDKQSVHLGYFYDVFENILSHGYRGKKGFGLNFVYRSRDFTVLLDLIANKCDPTACLASVKDITEIRSSFGRVRAWTRLSIMQKKLAENLASLIQEKTALSEIYEKDGILVSDEANIVSGILVGLNALDISIDLKSEASLLDLPVKSINYSIYLREKLPDSDDLAIDGDNSLSEQRINEIFDQKNFLEEINKKLELKNDQLNVKIQTLEKTNTSLSDKVAELKLENLELRNQYESIKADNEKLESDFKNKIESVYQDLKAERDTFNLSKTGLDTMYIELQRKFYEETKLRASLEAELHTQTTIKNEQEAALKLLENSLNDKHEIINILREQLEQVKSINLDFVNDGQKNEIELKRLNKELDETKVAMEHLNTAKIELEKKLEKLEQTIKKKDELCRNYSDQIEIQMKKMVGIEKDLSIEKNWRTELQTELNEKNASLKNATEKLDMLDQIEQENKLLKEEKEALLGQLDELEKTLEEMGSRLGTSHLRMEDFKEVTKQLHEFKWEKDDQVTICKLCTKDFNLARRKHHCRRCGGIYCNECSDNKMTLPSSSKPVRVCNTCYAQMLQKSSLIK